MMKIIRDCQIDPTRLEPIKECTATYDMESRNPSSDWPWNCLSTRTIAYSCGAITRSGSVLGHAHDAAELERCRSLAEQAANSMIGIEVGMGSEHLSGFAPFFVAANIDTEAETVITEDLIRKVFGGTIYPPARIWVEPLEERGEWWSKVCEDCEDCDTAEEIEDYLSGHRRIIDWFHGQRELHSAVFVMIGEIPLDAAYSSTSNGGCVFPRLAVGLTAAGSLAGICGYVVHT